MMEAIAIIYACLVLLASIGALGCFLQMLQEQRVEWSRGVSNGWRKSRLEEAIASGEWDEMPWSYQFDLLYDLPSSCPIHGEEAEKCGRMGHMAWTGWKGALEVRG